MPLPPPYAAYNHPFSDGTDAIGHQSLPTNSSAFVEAIVAELATPETKRKLMQEVEALANSVIQLNEAFERVRVGLAKIDDHNYMDKDGKPVDKFQPTWVNYQRCWNDLLWDSRDAATATEAYIKDFLEVIVPEVEGIENNNDLADAKMDLEAFINRTDPNSKPLSKEADHAQKRSQDFSDPTCGFEAFKRRFRAFAWAHTTEPGATVKEMQEDIARLDVEIDKCTAPCLDTAVPLALGGIGLGVAAYLSVMNPVTPAPLAIFVYLAPKFIMGIIIARVTVAITKNSDIVSQKKNLQIDRDRAQQKLDDLKAQFVHLGRMNADLDCPASMGLITDRLKAFSEIRNIVRYDAKLISDGLSADQGSQNDFRRHVELIKKSYFSVDEALSLYATQVSHSGAKK